MIWLWGLFRRSFVSQLIVGAAAFWAAWTVNDLVVARQAAKEERREVIDEQKQKNKEAPKIGRRAARKSGKPAPKRVRRKPLPGYR